MFIYRNSQLPLVSRFVYTKQTTNRQYATIIIDTSAKHRLDYPCTYNFNMTNIRRTDGRIRQNFLSKVALTTLLATAVGLSAGTSQ